MSSLEYQKQTGKLNLNSLKRKNRKPSPEATNAANMTKEQRELAELTKMQAPKNLAPVIMGGKKNPNFQLGPLKESNAMTASRMHLHQESTNTMIGL